MTTLNQIPIRKQVLAAFGALCLVLTAIGALFIFSLRTIEHRRQTQQARAHQKWEIADNVSKNMGLMQAEVLQHVLTTDAQELERRDRIIHQLDALSVRSLAEYEALLEYEMESNIHARFLRARKVYWDRTADLLTLSRVNRNEEAAEMVLSKQSPAYAEYQRVANE